MFKEQLHGKIVSDILTACCFSFDSQMETDLICNHRTNAVVECLLAGAESWMLSPLLGRVAAFTHASVLTDERMETYHCLLVFQSLDLSLSLLELLNLLLQFSNMYKRR